MERCTLVRQGSADGLMGFVSTDPSGCSAAAAHVLWEPLGPMRRTAEAPEHEAERRRHRLLCGSRARLRRRIPVDHRYLT